MTGVQTCALPICFPVTIEVIARSANGMTANHENGNHTVTDELVRKNPANRYTIPSNANSIRK